jgi:hypothetical protein
VEPNPNTQYELVAKQYQGAIDARILEIKQLRQDLKEGSTFEITYDLKNTGLTY